MARGQRKTKEAKSISQRLEENAIRIKETEEMLKALKDERKELEKAKREEEVDDLLAVIQENGLTLEEAKRFISQIADSKPQTA